MTVPEAQELRRYVESELDRVIRSHQGWHAEFRPSGWRLETRPGRQRESHLFWVLTEDSDTGDYLLEADPTSKEFLLWFGHHQAGADLLVTWIMRPAVHVPFEALWPPLETLPRFSIGDVLDCVLGAERVAAGFRSMRYPKNYISLT